MKAPAWILALLTTLTCALGPGCTTPRFTPLAPGQVALKIMTLEFNDYVEGYLVAPLDGTPYIPPKKPKRSTLAIAFNPKLPAPISLHIIWTYDNNAFGPTYREGYFSSRQMTVDQWAYNQRIPITSPIPENPEYLLLAFYPDQTVKAEILSKKQIEAGRLDDYRRDYINNAKYQNTK